MIKHSFTTKQRICENVQRLTNWDERLFEESLRLYIEESRACLEVRLWLKRTKVRRLMSQSTLPR